MTVLTNTFEINCSGIEGDHVSFEVWKIKGEISSLYKLIKELERNNTLITNALLVPNYLYIFFAIRCHFSLKQKIQTTIDELNSDLSVEKKTFSDFSELNNEERKLLTVSVKNWIRNTLIIEHTHKSQGSFIYPSNSEKFFNTENGNMVSISGFSLSCVVHNNFSLKVYVNLKNRIFKKINADESSLRAFSKGKTPSWVFTPFKGILGRLTNKEKDKSRSNENTTSQNQVTVLLEGTPISFECDDYLLAIDNNDTSIERYFPSQRNIPRQITQSRSKIQKPKITSTPSNSLSKTTKRTSNENSTNGKNNSSKKQKITETDTREDILPAYLYNRKEKKSNIIANNLTLSPSLTNLAEPIIQPQTDQIIEEMPVIINPLSQLPPQSLDQGMPEISTSQSQKVEDDGQALMTAMTADQFNELLDSFDCWGDEGTAEMPSQSQPEHSQPTIQQPVKTEIIMDNTVDTQLLNSTPINPQTPSHSLSSPIKSYEDIKQFKEILEHREAQRKSVQDLQRGLTEMNLNYEPQVKPTRQYSSFSSSFVGNKDEKSNYQKQEVAKNDYASYFTNPCYNSNSNEDRYYPTKTNFVPTSSYNESRLFNTPNNGFLQMLKDQERKTKKEKKEKQQNQKKEEINKENNDPIQPSNVEESFEEEIFAYDFTHSEATNVFDMILPNCHLSLSEILKRSLQILASDSELNKSDLLSFIMDGCWKDSDTCSEYVQKSPKIPTNILESIQVISRYYSQSDEASNNLNTQTEETLSMLYKVSDILSKIGDESIRGPLKDTSNCMHIDTPTVRVGYMEQWLDSQPDIISEWEKSLLEPYASPKKINYCVIGVEPTQFNIGDGVFSDLYGFFENLSTIYETCKLGTHIPIHNEFITDGILPVTYKYAQSSSASKSQKLQLEEFIEQFQKSAKRAEQGISSFYSNSSKEECVLIYVVFPFHLLEKIEENSPTSISSILYNVFGSIIENLQIDIPEVVPFIHFIDQKLVDEPYIHRPLATLKHISLSVYNKCRRQTKRWNTWSGYSSLLHEPSVVLTPIETNTDSSRNRSPFSEIQNQKLMFFCAYSITEEENGDFFVTCVWTDYPGNLLESAIFESSEFMTDEGRRSEIIDTIIHKIHEQSTIYMSSLSSGNQVDLVWEYTVCKVAPSDKYSQVPMSEEELNAWSKVRASVQKVAMYLTTLNDNPSTQFFKIRESSSHHDLTSCIHAQEDTGFIFSPSDEIQDQDSSRQDVVVYPKSILEIKLFVKENERGLHVGNVRQVCKHLCHLSWLTVSPLYPSRFTVLPIHIQLLRNINLNIMRYIQYISQK